MPEPKPALDPWAGLVLLIPLPNMIVLTIMIRIKLLLKTMIKKRKKNR